MISPKTENSIDGGDGNTQIGHNTGTINIGLTFDQHEHNVRQRLAELRADLERAHGAERQVLQNQSDAVSAALANLNADYEKTLAELVDLKTTLARFDNQIDRKKRAEADAALDRGDRALAAALLTELSAKARARREDAGKEEADLEFALGRIAEQEVRWHDAHRHYKRASSLTDNLEHLQAQARMTWRLHLIAEGIPLHKHLCDVIRAEFGEQSSDYATALGNLASLEWQTGAFLQAEATFRKALMIDQSAIAAAHPAYAIRLNNLAGVVRAQGRYQEAEGFFRQALAIDEATIGIGNPVYAIHLNNLASAVQSQGRYPEAEVLCRQALAIDESTIGTGHPDYAIHLNNLALLVMEQGRYQEAEGLYRQALAIDEATIGTGHPVYATHLNNLALLVTRQRRYPEAEVLYRQVLSIDEATIGTGHPDYAIHLNNLAILVKQLGRYAEAEVLYRQVLSIDEATIGTGHPVYAIHLNNLAGVVNAQGRHPEARELYWQTLAILRNTCGDLHPNTVQCVKSLISLLRSHFPEDPEIPTLNALVTSTSAPQTLTTP